MTTAVCFRCGTMKHGALVACANCGAAPRTEDELVLSVAMTDHYQSAENLARLASDIAGGNAPQLDPNTRRELRTALRDATDLAPGLAKALGIRVRPVNRRPWWKFWGRHASSQSTGEYKGVRREGESRTGDGSDALEEKWRLHVTELLRCGPFAHVLRDSAGGLLVMLHNDDASASGFVWLGENKHPQLWVSDGQGQPAVLMDAGSKEYQRPPAESIRSLALPIDAGPEPIVLRCATSGGSGLTLMTDDGTECGKLRLTMEGPALCLCLHGSQGERRAMMVLQDQGPKLIVFGG